MISITKKVGTLVKAYMDKFWWLNSGICCHVKNGPKFGQIFKNTKKKQTKYLRSSHFGNRQNLYNLPAKRPSSQPWFDLFQGVVSDMIWTQCFRFVWIMWVKQVNLLRVKTSLTQVQQSKNSSQRFISRLRKRSSTWWWAPNFWKILQRLNLSFAMVWDK